MVYGVCHVNDWDSELAKRHSDNYCLLEEALLREGGKGAGKMAQQVKAGSCYQTEKLTSISGAHRVGGENQFCLISTCAAWDTQASLPLPAI